MCGAFENLPAPLKERAKKLQIKHDGTRDSGGNVRKGVVDDPNPMTAKGYGHPAVIKDPGTGKPALFLGRRPARYVVGLPLEESEALLDELWKHAIGKSNVYEHHWSVGDVLIWSNYSTMHRRDEFDKGTIRRITAARSRVRAHQRRISSKPRGRCPTSSSSAAASRACGLRRRCGARPPRSRSSTVPNHHLFTPAPLPGRDRRSLGARIAAPIRHILAHQRNCHGAARRRHPGRRRARGA